ncbi:restriction endonuclease subunit S [Nocardia sp. NPDC051911]|uniref:restriction endonuclease subunit S n=1 Tax=Nocardia sp. NPDC051911 TaxID=3154648 RepID=UPI003420BD60
MTTVVEHPAVTERISMWLGSLPTGWTGARLFEVADAWTSNVDKHSVDGEPAVRLANYVDVYHNDSIVGSLNFMSATATREQIKRFRIRLGDTLITKDSETADDIGIPAFVEYEADDLICGYHLAIVRPAPEKVVPKFLYWALRSAPIARQWEVLASGVTRVGIRSTDLDKVTIPRPPLNEQRAIADFLDHETAQIDTLVAKQEEFVALLRERRLSQTADVLAALGEPDTQLRRVARIQTGVTLSGDGNPSFPLWPYLRVANVQMGHVDLTEVKEIHLSAREAAASMLRPGDVLMTEGGDIDKLGRGTVWDGRISPMIHQNHVFAVRADPAMLVPEYLARLLDSPTAREYFYRTAKKTTNLASTNKTIVGRLPMRVPSIREQHAAVDDLDEQTARIDALIARAQEHISLAKERRAALITAAVTGQFDVHTARKAS